MAFRAVPQALATATRGSGSIATCPAIRAYHSSPPTLGCLHNRRSPRQTEQCSNVSRRQSRFSSTEHAIANPTLAGIEKRWEAMPPQEQAELWMQLRDRMKVDWHDMTLQEKKAGTYLDA